MNNVLVVIDMQNDFIDGSLGSKEAVAIVPNVVEKVNIKTRKYWNFIKTINCNFDGDIPQSDLKIIKTIFDKGITFWHSPENIYKYNLDNVII